MCLLVSLSDVCERDYTGAEHAAGQTLAFKPFVLPRRLPPRLAVAQTSSKDRLGAVVYVFAVQRKGQ